ncbi:hypothetical protein [Bacillus infantis]|uniref:hypothetical protein n=1 Tax=Bacillus infantis TaxID=324767 RepID=UPI003CF54055
MKTVNNELLGTKVLGNWGSAGFTYGTVSEVLPEYNEIAVTWEENEDGLTTSYYELKDVMLESEVRDCDDKVGVYLLNEQTTKEAI